MRASIILFLTAGLCGCTTSQELPKPGQMSSVIHFQDYGPTARGLHDPRPTHYEYGGYHRGGPRAEINLIREDRPNERLVAGRIDGFAYQRELVSNSLAETSSAIVSPFAETAPETILAGRLYYEIVPTVDDDLPGLSGLWSAPAPKGRIRVTLLGWPAPDVPQRLMIVDLGADGQAVVVCLYRTPTSHFTIDGEDAFISATLDLETRLACMEDGADVTVSRLGLSKAASVVSYARIDQATPNPFNALEATIKLARWMLAAGHRHSKRRHH